jgi:hypothetical protein
MRKKLEENPQEMETIRLSIETISLLRRDIISQKQVADEIGITEQVLGMILNRRLKNLNWGTKLKIMRWCESNSSQSMEDTDENITVGKTPGGKNVISFK